MNSLDSDLEIQQSTVDALDLKVVYARKINLNQSLNIINKPRKNGIGYVGKNKDTSNSISNGNSLNQNDVIDSNRKYEQSNLTTTPFKFNPNLSAFHAFDSPKDHKKISTTNNIIEFNTNKIKSKPFSVTPGPQKTTNQIENILLKTSQTMNNNTNNEKEFQLFYHHNDINDPSFIIPMRYFSNGHNDFNNNSNQPIINNINMNDMSMNEYLLRKTTDKVPLVNSPDIIDIVRDVVTNESSKYIFDGSHDDIYTTFNPSLQLFNDTNNNNSNPKIDDYNNNLSHLSNIVSSLRNHPDDLDICNTAKDLGTLNLYNSASFAKDYTQINKVIPRNHNHIKDDLNYLYSSIETSSISSLVHHTYPIITTTTTTATSIDNTNNHSSSYSLLQNNQDSNSFSLDNYQFLELNNKSITNTSHIDHTSINDINKFNNDMHETTYENIRNEYVNPTTYNNNNNGNNNYISNNNSSYNNNSKSNYQLDYNKITSTNNNQRYLTNKTEQPSSLIIKHENETMNNINVLIDEYSNNTSSNGNHINNPTIMKLSPNQDLYYEPNINMNKEYHMKSNNNINQFKDNKHHNDNNNKSIPQSLLSLSAQSQLSYNKGSHPNYLRNSKESTRLDNNNSNNNSNSNNNMNILQSSIDSQSSITSKINKIHIDNPNHMKTSNDNLNSTLNKALTSSSTSSSININKQELIESPRSKAAYKDFYKKFRNKEKDSFEDARIYALDALSHVPNNAKWRIYLELADLSKRNNQIQEARNFYSEACLLQPKANLCWLEWSKMEEENGKLWIALNILLLGLKVCKVNESLLTRVIKLNERLHKYSEVRGMLSVLKYESIDRVWKAILEGTLFEARTGNISISRKLFKYLMNYVSWYGPIYFEAFRLEEKENNDYEALKIIRKGLKELPKYGPLWLGLLRIMEREDMKLEHRSWQQGYKPQLINLNKETYEAVRMISKELTWKIYFEKSQVEERVAEITALAIHIRTNKSLFKCRNKLFEESRKSLLRSLLICPSNLRWKIFLVGARLELSVGNINKSRSLLRKAFQEVPMKSKSNVYIECSRIEEFLGDIDLARKLLTIAQQDVSVDWKVYLEMILLEARVGNIEKAALLAKDAIQIYAGTGRLWAIYIQLCHRLEYKLSFTNSLINITNSFEISHLNELSLSSSSKINHSDTNENKEDLFKYKWLIKELVMKLAITEVPKSGEVWCERGRCYMNPLHLRNFDLSHTQRCLCFAIQFTPQYGDTFIEFIRLELLCQVLLPKILEVLKLPFIPFLKSFLFEDMESDAAEMTRNFHSFALYQSIKPDINISVPASEKEKLNRCLMIKDIDNMNYDFGNLKSQYQNISLKNLFRRCVNADPNYGFSWFYCRKHPYDIPNFVLENAKHKIIHELIETQNIYARAILYYIYRYYYKHCNNIRNSTLFSIDMHSNCNTMNLYPQNNQDDNINYLEQLNISQYDPINKVRPGSAPSSQRVTNNNNNNNNIKINQNNITSKSLELPSNHNKLSFILNENQDNKINISTDDESITMIRDNNLFKDDIDVYNETFMKEESKDIPLIRINECIQDINNTLPFLMNQYNKYISTATSITNHVLNSSSIIPFIELKHGFIYSYTDFVTGIIELNQIIFNNQLDLELKRKILFGTDSILS